MEPQEVLFDIRERLARIETKQDAQNGLREKVDCIERTGVETESRSRSNTHRLDKLEEANTWLWRKIVGAIIAAGISGGIGALAIFK